MALFSRKKKPGADQRELLERLKTFWKRKAQEIERKEEGEKDDQVGID